jgi:predicted phosphodiesterase
MKSIRLFFLMLMSVPLMQAQTPVHTEFLGKPTDHSISVQMFFDQDVELQLRCGTQSGNYNLQSAWQNFKAGEPAAITLNGLQSSQQYYYRMAYRKPGSSGETLRPEYRFRTAPPAGTSFSFVIQADPHLDEQSDTGIYSLCLKNQLADNPDFMIDLGDILMSDKLRNAAKQVPRDTVTFRSHLIRAYYEQISHSTPVFMAIGNHEGECGWLNNANGNNVAVWGTLDRKKYFMNPEPDGFYSGDTTQYKFVGRRASFYAWEWGDALFIVLDPYWHTTPKPDSLNGWRWTLGKTQYDWLKTTLERSDKKFKFVFAHQLVGGDPDGRGGVEFASRYEWGGYNLDGTYGFDIKRPGWYKPIRDLLQEHRVNIFFHGHDHFFGKQQQSCLIYQEVPQPSHPNYSSAGQADDYGYFEGQILPNSGHLRVNVTPNGVKVEYVRVYLPRNETATRKNRDVSASYYIGARNCYDSLSTNIPVLWNDAYSDELVYPNPFSRETQIRFSLANDAPFSLSIYNGQGQMVRSLWNGQTMRKGSYLMVWDGRNDAGSDLAPGIYYLQFRETGGAVRTQKITLQP